MAYSMVIRKCFTPQKKGEACSASPDIVQEILLIIGLFSNLEQPASCQPALPEDTG